MGAEELIDFLEHGNIQNSVKPAHGTHGSQRRCPHDRGAQEPAKYDRHHYGHHQQGRYNIAAFTDKNRGEIAYSIIDTDTAYSAGVVADIEKIDGVIRVRVIQD